MGVWSCLGFQPQRLIENDYLAPTLRRSTKGYLMVDRGLAQSPRGLYGWGVMCKFDRFHLTFNFKSKVSSDVFKNKKNVNGYLHFIFRCHINIICLVVCVISISKVLNDVWVYFHKSHYMSKSKLCVPHWCAIYFCTSFCVSNIKKLQKQLSKIHISKCLICFKCFLYLFVQF